MSISKLQNLDLLGVIGSYANAQELGRMACTNKRWRDAVYEKVHRALLTTYAQEPALRSYVASLQLEKTPLTVLFKKIIQDVRDIGRGKEQLASIKWPAVSLQSTPTTLANWISQKKAENLLVLFGKVAQEIPAAQAFLNTLAEAGNKIEQAAAIRTWLQANRALLNTITDMDLSYSELTILPDEIALFTQLQRLWLRDNQLQTLPASLGNLTLLLVLDLDSNPLAMLPAWLGNLTQLQELWLDKIPLQTLPAELGNLTQLQKLNLDNHRLQTLPAWLGNLTQLQELSLSDNQLQTLPAWLGNLTQLKHLLLTNNQLQTLPISLGNLTQLKALWLGANPIQFVPKELKCSSNAAICYNAVIQAAQELPETQPNCRTPEETKLQPSPWQQIVDAFYSCFSAIASFAWCVWTRLMAALSEVG